MMTPAERAKLLREEISVLEARVDQAQKQVYQLRRMLADKRLQLEDLRREQLAPLSVLKA